MKMKSLVEWTFYWESKQLVVLNIILKYSCSGVATVNSINFFI